MCWFAANLTTYLLGAAAYEFGKRVLDVSPISKGSLQRSRFSDS